ncbi:MAG: peptidylprolyl isomerase [Desulfobacterales bacterium]|jgi:hypothetical protein
MKAFTVKKLVREPLVHFLVIGAGLFLVFGLIREPAPEAPNRIVVDAGQVAQLNAQFKRTWMRPPTDAELVGLIENHVRDEVYYREALAMGLDQNDPLIRRRMRQKLEFILEDLSADSKPSEQELNQFLGQYPDRFRLEAQVSFHQVYLNPDKHGNLETHAARILKDLQAGARPESLGDPTLIGRTFELAPLSVIARSFGDSFAQDIVKLSPGKWTGPLYSGLGGHLVLVTEHRKARMPELTEVRAQVEREYLAQRRRELKDLAYQKLREGYEVVMEPTTTPGNMSDKALAAESSEGVGR